MMSDVLSTSAGILGLIAGAKLFTSKYLLEPNSHRLDKVSKQIADFDPELFDSLVNIRTLLNQQRTNHANLDAITHGLSRLITLDKRIFELPRRRDWWFVGVEYKQAVTSGLIELQTHTKIQEEDLERIRKTISDLCHNIRLNNEIIFEDQITKNFI